MPNVGLFSLSDAYLELERFSWLTRSADASCSFEDNHLIFNVHELITCS